MNNETNRQRIPVTFSLNIDLYNEFKKYCKIHGLVYSKQIEFFMEDLIKYDKNKK